MSTKQKKSEWMYQAFIRCVMDRNFKTNLLKNPEATLEKEFALPKGTKIKCLENTESTTYLVLPFLTDEEWKEASQQAKAAEKRSEVARLNWLLIQCVKDQDLKQRFLQDPKALLEQECEIKLPANIHFKAIEDTENLTHFIVPYVKSDELSEDELASLSGGVQNLAAPGLATALYGVGDLIYRGLIALAEHGKDSPYRKSGTYPGGPS